MTFPLIMIWMRKEDFHYNRQPSPIHIYKSITTSTTSYHNVAPHLSLMSEQSQYNIDIQIPITVLVLVVLRSCYSLGEVFPTHTKYN